MAHEIHTAYVTPLPLSIPSSSHFTLRYVILYHVRHANCATQYSAKLILPGALAKHAVAEGAKALRLFNARTKQTLR